MATTERALLLSDDRDAERLALVDPAKVILLTTWDDLRQLEDAQRIKRAARHLLAKQRQGRTNDEPLEARWGVATRSIVDAVTQIGR